MTRENNYQKCADIKPIITKGRVFALSPDYYWQSFSRKSDCKCVPFQLKYIGNDSGTIKLLSDWQPIDQPISRLDEARKLYDGMMYNGFSNDGYETYSASETDKIVTLYEHHIIDLEAKIKEQREVITEYEDNSKYEFNRNQGLVAEIKEQQEEIDIRNIVTSERITDLEIQNKLLKAEIDRLKKTDDKK